MPLERRQSTATVGRNDYSHPYLSSSARLSTKQGPRRTPKRELGLMDLFLFKMFGCFQNDDMPPPNAEVTVQRNERESSASTITTSVTNTNTTTTASALSTTPEAPKKGKKNTKANKSAKLAAAKSWAHVPQHRATLNVGKEVARMPGEKSIVEKSKLLNEDINQDKNENENELHQEKEEEENEQQQDKDDIKTKVVETIVPLNDTKYEDLDRKESSHKLELDQSVPAPSLQGRVSRMSAMFEQE